MLASMNIGSTPTLVSIHMAMVPHAYNSSTPDWAEAVM